MHTQIGVPGENLHMHGENMQKNLKTKMVLEPMSKVNEGGFMKKRIKIQNMI